MCVSCSVMSDSLRPHGPWLTRVLSPWDFPGKSTEVGCHCLLQGIFPTRDRTRISCIAGRCFTVWATRKAQYVCIYIWWLRIHLPMQETQETWVRKTPWRRKWKTTLESLPGKFHGQRSLVVYIQSIGWKRVRHNWARVHTRTHTQSLYVQLHHFAVHVKLTWHCKSTIN